MTIAILMKVAILACVFASVASFVSPAKKVISSTTFLVDGRSPGYVSNINSIASPSTFELNSHPISVSWFYRDCWGFGTVPEHGDRDLAMLGYAKMLCNALGADGIATDAEIEWVQGYLSCKGFGSLADKVDEFAKAAEKKTLEEVLQDTQDAQKSVEDLKFAGRAIVYDCIRASMADGLDKKEDEAVRAIAKGFNVDANLYEKIKQLAFEEEEHRRKKTELVTPGHPDLAPIYR